MDTDVNKRKTVWEENSNEAITLISIFLPILFYSHSILIKSGSS